MPAPKQKPQVAAQASFTAPSPAPAGDRKPWKKKTPADVVLGQIDKLRDDVAEKESELTRLKNQLQKMEEVRKIFESS